MTPIRGGNAGFAGERGEFEHLSEAQVRGTDYFAGRPVEGVAGGGVCAYPYILPVRNPEARLFDGPYRQRLEKILARYPEPRAALLPLLNLAQEVQGWVSPAALERVAEILGLAPAYVRGVATFYTMYNLRPVGRYLVQVCTNVCCSVCGGDEVLEAFLEEAGVAPGETTGDGLFTFMEVECLGACGFPVAVQINDRYFENVAAADVPALLDRLRATGTKVLSGAGGGNARGPDGQGGAGTGGAASPGAGA
ncbi:MAG: NADH-quinone oxidoreductase subunit NuoE [Longimicrobiales bacterium]